MIYRLCLLALSLISAFTLNAQLVQEVSTTLPRLPARQVVSNGSYWLYNYTIVGWKAFDTPTLMDSTGKELFSWGGYDEVCDMLFSIDKGIYYYLSNREGRCFNGAQTEGELGAGDLEYPFGWYLYLPDETSYSEGKLFQGSDSVISVFYPFQSKIRHLRVNYYGKQLSLKTLNFSDKVNAAVEINPGKILLASGTSLIVIDSMANILSTTNTGIAIKKMEYVNGTILIASDEIIYSLDTDLNVVKSMDLNEVFLKIEVIKIFPDGLCVVGHSVGDTVKRALYFNQDLSLFRSVFINLNEDFEVVDIARNKKFLFLLGDKVGFEHQRNYGYHVVNDQSQQPAARQDIALEELKVYLVTYEKTGFNKYKIKYVANAKVRNNGPDTITYFELNHYKNGDYCDFDAYFEYFRDPIPPGGVREFTIPDQETNEFSDPDSSFAVELCYWTSGPNELIDVRHSNDRNCASLDLTLGIDDHLSDNNLSQIYPNPANDKIFISVSDGDNWSCEIADVSGKLLLKFSNIDNNGLDLSALKSGLYLIRLENRAYGQKSTHKLVIAK